MSFSSLIKKYKYFFLSDMSEKSINKLNLIQANIKKISANNLIKPEIICITKTFSFEKIRPLVESGHTHFGENKVQEAEKKWIEVRKTNDQLRIHMVGKLQTNKAKKAVETFDFIHSLESAKLADALKKREIELNKKLSYFIQINIGNENQKAGISPNDAKEFLSYCTSKIHLNVIGLMIIPPNDNNTEKYFEEISLLNSKLGLKQLSMGMSDDYELATKYKSTFLRIGSAIMGPRNINE